jgi:hypothetical protein
MRNLPLRRPGRIFKFDRAFLAALTDRAVLSEQSASATVTTLADGTP